MFYSLQSLPGKNYLQRFTSDSPLIRPTTNPPPLGSQSDLPPLAVSLYSIFPKGKNIFFVPFPLRSLRHLPTVFFQGQKNRLLTHCLPPAADASSARQGAPPAAPFFYSHFYGDGPSTTLSTSCTKCWPFTLQQHLVLPVWSTKCFCPPYTFSTFTSDSPLAHSPRIRPTRLWVVALLALCEVPSVLFSTEFTWEKNYLQSLPGKKNSLQSLPGKKNSFNLSLWEMQFEKIEK